MADFRLRVTYTKAGRLVMLSHLEICHALERAVRRADLPYAVSQGFSPHMKLSFGSALPVGVGGDQEIFDVNLTEYVDPQEALSRLVQSSPEDLAPLTCAYVTRDVPAASVIYPLSTYKVQFSGDPSGLVLPDEVVVTRKRKERRFDPREYLVGDIQISGTNMVFTLESKPEGSLRADVLIQEMTKGSDLQVLSIKRIRQAAYAGSTGFVG